MKKTESKEKLLKACGNKVYHVTYESQLNNILTHGLINFWFGIDLDDCANMAELAHQDSADDSQIVIVIPTNLLQSHKCDFTVDSGNGTSDEWFGTGFYSGAVDIHKCKIYDLN